VTRWAERAGRETHMSVLNPDFFGGRVVSSRLPLGVSSLSVDVGARM
jgi:hypothetical protein